MLPSVSELFRPFNNPFRENRSYTHTMDTCKKNLSTSNVHETETDTETERETERETQRQTGRQTDRGRETETERVWKSKNKIA